MSSRRMCLSTCKDDSDQELPQNGAQDSKEERARGLRAEKQEWIGPKKRDQGLPKQGALVQPFMR